MEWITVRIEREQSNSQGGQAANIARPTLDPVVTSVAEQEDPDGTHRADEYVSQAGVVVAAHIILDLDPEDEPPHRAEHDRQEQTDGADRATYTQVGNDQGVRAFRQEFDH